MRIKSKTALRGVPSRCLVADGLTRIGLEKIFMNLMQDSEVLFHEASEQQLKRERQEADRVGNERSIDAMTKYDTKVIANVTANGETAKKR